MFRNSLLALIVATAAMLPATAYADACSNRARALVNGIPGATLLTVRSATSGSGQTVCQARIKLPPKGGQPGRVVIRQFRP